MNVVEALESILSKMQDLVKAKTVDDFMREAQRHSRGQRGEDGEKGSEYSVVDGADDEDDEAARWLQEHGEDAMSSDAEEADEVPSKTVEPTAPETKQRRSSEWKPRPDHEYTEDQKREMANHLADGYTMREAERMVGAHLGPHSIQQAKAFHMRPSMPSEKMLGHLKEMASEYVTNARKSIYRKADPTINKEKYIRGKLSQAIEGHYGDISSAMKDFTSSEEYKKMSFSEKAKAAKKFKEDWAKANPDRDSHQRITSVHTELAPQINKQWAQSQEEKIAHILHGGHVDPTMQEHDVGTSVGVSEAMKQGMADQARQSTPGAVAQHVGSGHTEEGEEAQHTTIKDPAAAFAAANPEFVRQKLSSMLPKEAQERLKHIDSAKASNQAKPAEPAKPRIEIRRKTPQGS